MPPASPDTAAPHEPVPSPNASRGSSTESDPEEPHGDSDAHELPYREELRRKALHLLALTLPLGTALLGKEGALWVLVPGALFALCCDALRSRSPRFAQFIRRLFGGIMRADEWEPEEAAANTGLGIRINGATWTLVTMAALTLLFPVPVAVTAFSLFMVGDAAAALVGRRYGRIPWGDGPRTVEGSIAFVVAAALTVAPLVGIGYIAMPWWIPALAVVVATGAEALPRPLNDNLRVPFTAALVLHFLG